MTVIVGGKKLPSPSILPREEEEGQRREGTREGKEEDGRGGKRLRSDNVSNCRPPPPFFPFLSCALLLLSPYLELGSFIHSAP